MGRGEFDGSEYSCEYYYAYEAVNGTYLFDIL